MEKVTDVKKVVNELLEVLDSNKVPMRSLETVLDTLKDEVYSNTLIQNGTAQEVPVQEQPTKTLEFVNKELGTNLTREQYDKIAIRDCCVPEYRAEEILRLLKTLNLI